MDIVEAGFEGLAEGRKWGELERMRVDMGMYGNQLHQAVKCHEYWARVLSLKWLQPTFQG